MEAGLIVSGGSLNTILTVVLVHVASLCGPSRPFGPGLGPGEMIEISGWSEYELGRVRET